MIVLKILIWIWVITFLIDVIWYHYNPNALKDFYEKNNLDHINYDLYLVTIFIATMIIAPRIFLSVIVGEIKNYFIIFRLKRQLKRILKELDNEELEKDIKEQINNINY